MKPIAAFAFAAAFLLADAASAQEILKREPPAGGLNPGQKILVDNGRCPKGQVMEVTGGNLPSRAQRNAAAAAGGNVNAGGSPRQYNCVARPR
jgi:hypothetical protein